MNVTGEANRPRPVEKCHKSFPLLASIATRLPSSSPVKTTPPAVERVPAHMVPDPGIGYSHFMSPLRMSSARKKNLPGSVGIPSLPVPRKPDEGNGSFAEATIRSHCSRVTTYKRPVAGLYEGDIQLEAPLTEGQTFVPAGVGILAGFTFGRPLSSNPLVQSSFRTNGFACRNS